MRTMLFASEIEPVSGTDIINTVRRGIKWATLTVGEEIELFPADMEHHVPLGDKVKAEVTKVVSKRFCDIDDYELIYNFDPRCRNWVNLSERMAELYKGFDEFEIVTVVDVRLI